MQLIPDTATAERRLDELLAAGRTEDAGPRGYPDPRQLTTPLGSGAISFLTALSLQQQAIEGVAGYTSPGAGFSLPDFPAMPPTVGLPDFLFDFGPQSRAWEFLADPLFLPDQTKRVGGLGNDEDGFIPPLTPPADQVFPPPGFGGLTNRINIRGGRDTKKVKVSANDRRARYLKEKLIGDDGAGANLKVELDEVNDGGDEDLKIKVTRVAVMAALPQYSIIMWYGTTGTVPAGWVICDGNNGTPNMTDLVPIGAGNLYTKGTAYGALAHNHPVHTAANIGDHTVPVHTAASIGTHVVGGHNVAVDGITDHQCSEVVSTIAAHGGHTHAVGAGGPFLQSGSNCDVLSIEDQVHAAAVGAGLTHVGTLAHGGSPFAHSNDLTHTSVSHSELSHGNTDHLPPVKAVWFIMKT